MGETQRRRYKAEDSHKPQIHQHSPNFLHCGLPGDGGPGVILLRVPSLHTPNFKYPRSGYIAVPITGGGMSVNHCFLSYTLPQRESLSGVLTLMC